MIVGKIIVTVIMIVVMMVTEVTRDASIDVVHDAYMCLLRPCVINS